MADLAAKTLTDIQQRRSLSGSKSVQGLGRNVRNVLAKPYNKFWPLINAQAESELQELLESLLPAARKVVYVEDLKLLRNMKGKKREEDRAKIRQKIWDNNPGSKENRHNLVIGVNDVSRSLEEDTLTSLMISNEADPPILTSYLATLAATRNVPFVVLQNLKKYTKEGMDISSLAVGLKKSVAEDKSNHYHPLHLKIAEIFKIIAKKSLPVDIEDVTQSDNLDFPVKPEEARPAKIQDVASLEVQPPVKPVITSRKNNSPSEIYLIRSSRKYRVFVPGKGMNNGDSSTCSMFISLSDRNENSTILQTEKSPREVLGSSSKQDTSSFPQNAKRTVLEQSPEPMETDSFVSLISMPSAEECQTEVKTEVKTKIETNVKKDPVPFSKPVKRYFSTLAPLKVKRIQSNPQKVKKNQKGKKK